MGQRYGQLSLEERIEIYRLHAGGKSQNKIASALDRAPSTISRELRRNSRPSRLWQGGYQPVRAQQLTMISHESIYRFIYHRTAQKDYWHRLLPRHKLRRGHRGRRGGSPASFIKQRRPITERPAEVEGREVPGHWEADFMLFARYGQGLLVLHERQTRFNIVQHPVDRKAVLTARKIARQLRRLPQQMRKTISFDNGTEFAEHHRLHKALGVQTFFCDPHSPWQKGGVENSIGRLRRSLPRKTDLKFITAAALKRHVQRLNNTPRKCLDFKTPAEAFLKLKSTVALQT
jgi:IS30 family transposase